MRTPFYAAIALLTCNPAAAVSQTVWTPHEAWSVSIGDQARPGHELFQVRDATRLADGRVVILNGGSDEILVFSATGDLLERVGGRGAGPGEYQALRTVRRDGDQLWVYDAINARVTRLGPRFDVVETHSVRYEIEASTPVPGRLRPFWGGAVPLARGTVSMMESFRRGEGLFDDSVSVGVFAGGTLREVSRLGRGQMISVRVENSGLTKPIPFGPTALYGSGPAAFVFGESHSIQFRVLDQEGSEIGRVEAVATPRPVRPQDWDQFKAALRAEHAEGVRIRGMATRPGPTVERLLATTPRGQDFPLFDLVTMDDFDRIWVRQYSLGGAHRTWQSLSPSDGFIAFLEIPAGWEVLEFGMGHVVVLLEDELGVEIVRVYQTGQ